MESTQAEHDGLLDAMSCLAWLCRPDGSVVFLNRWWSDFTGVRPSDLVGPGRLALIHADERNALLAAERSDPPGAAVAASELDLRVRHRGGVWRWHRARIVVTETPRGPRRLGVAQDVERARHLEHELVQSQERLHFAARAGGFTIWDWNLAELRVLRDRRREGGSDEFSGAEPSPLAAWFEAVHPTDRERVEGSLREAIECGRSRWTGELAFLGGAGTYETVMARGTILYDGDGAPIRLIGALIDVSGERRLERALAERVAELQLSEQRAIAALRTRDDFLAVAAHELRTPMTALGIQIEGMAPIVDDLESEAPRVRLQRKLAMADRQCDRLVRLIEGLLDVARVRSQQMTLELDEFDLCQLVREVLEPFTEQARRAGCEVRVSMVDSLVGRWDRVRLDQVLSNLLSNAIKYGERAPIDVGVSAYRDDVVLTVRDAGIGLSEEDAGRIFGKFERAVSPQHYGGLGLGLYITRQIVEAHGGTIEVTSRPGAGATMRVRLPRWTPRARAHDAEPTVGEARP